MNKELSLNLLLVDDHPLFRGGLRCLLSDLGRPINFHETPGVDSIAQYADTRMDLVLLDLGLQGTSGVDALSIVLNTLDFGSVVVISSEHEAYKIRQCIEAGAAGFIPKSSTPEILIEALRLIMAGGTYLPPDVLDEVGSGGARDSRPEQIDRERAEFYQRITPRQLDSLMLAIQGKPNKDIAFELSIAEGTVKLHLTAAYRALGVSSRPEAVFAAARLGIVAGTVRQQYP